MDFIYDVPEELKHYDAMLESWNTMTNLNISNEVPTIIQNVVQWWENYPQKDKKQSNEVPRNVWKILEKFKITELEKVYGIYYTLEYMLGDEMCLEISSIQFNDNGQVDTAVIIQDYMICSNKYYNIKSVDYTILQQLSQSIKA